MPRKESIFVKIKKSKNEILSEKNMPISFQINNIDSSSKSQQKILNVE